MKTRQADAFLSTISTHLNCIDYACYVCNETRLRIEAMNLKHTLQLTKNF